MQFFPIDVGRDNVINATFAFIFAGYFITALIVLLVRACKNTYSYYQNRAFLPPANNPETTRQSLPIKEIELREVVVDKHEEPGKSAQKSQNDQDTEPVELIRVRTFSPA